jgi:hypothetical protein
MKAKAQKIGRWVVVSGVWDGNTAIWSHVWTGKRWSCYSWNVKQYRTKRQALNALNRAPDSGDFSAVVKSDVWEGL